MTTVTYKCDSCGKKIDGRYYLKLSCDWVERIGVKSVIANDYIDLCPDCFKNLKKFLNRE